MHDVTSSQRRFCPYRFQSSYFSDVYVKKSFHQYQICYVNSFDGYVRQNGQHFLMNHRQQTSPLLYCIEIWPVRNSRRIQRETNHYIARCESVLALAWSYFPGRWPDQLMIDLQEKHQQLAVICRQRLKVSNHETQQLIQQNDKSDEPLIVNYFEYDYYSLAYFNAYDLFMFKCAIVPPKCHASLLDYEFSNLCLERLMFHEIPDSAGIK